MATIELPKKTNYVEYKKPCGHIGGFESESLDFVEGVAAAAARLGLSGDVGTRSRSSSSRSVSLSSIPADKYEQIFGHTDFKGDKK